MVVKTRMAWLGCFKVVKELSLSFPSLTPINYTSEHT
jgi:hypothetical protein